MAKSAEVECNSQLSAADDTNIDPNMLMIYPQVSKHARPLLLLISVSSSDSMTITFILIAIYQSIIYIYDLYTSIFVYLFVQFQFSIPPYAM